MYRLFVCLFVLLSGNTLFAQTNIGGILNQYAAVRALDQCAATITVDNTDGWEGKRVIMIQMKGATINETNTIDFGRITDLNNAGRYEVNTVIGILPPNRLQLEFQPSADFDLTQQVQIVDYPTFSGSVNVDTELIPQAWNGETGGILALEVTDTLTLNAPIDATATGFRGGERVSLPSNCQFFISHADYFYAQGNWRGAAKGEGISQSITGKEWGRGRQANGGGGGNDHNSGGGGGSHYGKGGRGGQQTPPTTFGCSGETPGRAGAELESFIAATPTDRLFLGGGGGAGHTDDGNTGPNGGHGGGIIVLKAGTLNSNGFVIASNGAAQPAASEGGSGGGGGGTVLTEIDRYLGTSTRIEANGGQGSDVNNPNNRCGGPGGGGGGGLILLKSGTVSAFVNAGQPGVNTDQTPCGSTTAAISGEAGEIMRIQTLDLVQATGSAGIANFPTDTDLPDTLTLCPNTPFDLESGITNLDYEYQWHLGFPSQAPFYIPLANAGNVSGVRTPTLNISDLQGIFADSIVLFFDLQITGTCGNETFTLNDTVYYFVLDSVPLGQDFQWLANGSTVDFTYAGNPSYSYSWNFGDGTTSTEENPTHTYSQPGVYVVELEVASNCNSTTLTQTIIISAVVSAGFVASGRELCAGGTIGFTNTSQGDNLQFEWLFEGGEPAASTDENPTVRYPTDGSYDVRLITFSGGSRDTLLLADWILVRPSPQADFEAIIQGLSVQFNNTSVNATGQVWSFGDGGNSTAVNPLHTYDAPGIYNVTLSVTNGPCASAAGESIQIIISNTSENVTKSWTIAPNPTSGRVRIQGNLAKATVRLHDLNGRSLWQQQLGLPTEINLGHFPKGAYLLTIQTPTGIQTERIFIMNE